MTMRTRNTYSTEFKEEAVRLVVKEGRPVRDVAKELGLHPSSLFLWKKQYMEKMNQSAPSLKGALKPSDLEAENQRLRRELEKMTEQRDILKKAVGIFSEPGSRSTSSSPANRRSTT